MTELPGTTTPRLAKWLFLAGTVLTLGFVVWSFADRFTGHKIQEPLEWDECLNLENYSWLGFDRDGSPKLITRADETLGQPRPSKLQLAFGMYRALGVWREPNDHIPHSVLLNAAMVFSPADERVARIPALVGALIFTLAIGWYARQSGFSIAWPLAILLAACWPYVHFYSMQARGYSWMLAFQVLHLIALRWVSLKPTSVWRGSISTLIGLASFLNIVSLAVDWIFPVYLTLWLFPPIFADEQPVEVENGLRIAYRRNVLIQFGIFALVGVVFFLDHLPYVILANQIYGIPTTLNEFPGRLKEIAIYLCPTLGWQIVGGLGVLGWLIMLTEKRARTLGIGCFAVVLVSLAHFVGTHKVPYLRTCAYVIPPLILGSVYVVERLLRQVGETPGACLRTFAVIGVGVFGFVQLVPYREEVSVLAKYRNDIRDNPFSGTPYVMVDRESYIRIRHFPADYLSAINEVDRLKKVDGLAILGKPTVTRGTPAEQWETRPAGDMQISYATAKAVTLNESVQPKNFPVVIWWQPDTEKVGLRNEHLYEILGEQRGNLRSNYRLKFSKLEFTSNLFGAEFFITNPQDFRAIKDVVLKGTAKIGGPALLIEPLP